MNDNRPVTLVPRIRWGEPPLREGEFLLPVGTVTLLLADVEGSSRLWETDPEAAGDALARLDVLAGELVGRHGGVRPIEQGEGDSFVAAFARAADAIACALAMQRALADHRLRVRVGVHTGDVQVRDDAFYVGQSINRAARLRDIAHGGQTVLSRTTHDLVVDRLPEDASLRDLGTHRLRDLQRAEHVFELCHPSLPADFPPLRSLDAHRHNLPVERTSFVGRYSEMDDVRRLLGETSLFTLHGAGGCGKTRLAVHVAADVLDRHPDGAWFVDLTRTSDPEVVPSAVAAALALRDPAEPVAETVARFIGEKRMLVILDNCEHVVATCASLVDLLLGRCPSLHVLATSREPLAVSGEVTFHVPSLPFPAERDPTGIEGVSQYDAVQLFCERASRIRSGFALDDDNAGAVAEVCRRLDGIPLAIELAASRTRAFTPRQIADALEERFRFLTGGARTAMPRQQTLRASVDWSYDLLTATERAVLRRLAVFAGGFTLAAAQDVCAGDDVEGHQVVDQVSLLVDKSLVHVEDGDRYRLLETVRQYCAERLEEASETDATRTRQRDAFLAIAEEAEPGLEGPEWSRHVARLAPDYENLRAALEWSRSTADGQALLRLAAALAAFWRAHGPLTEGSAWLDAALALGADAPPGLRAKALVARCWTALIGFDLETMASSADDAVALARDIGDERLEARSLLYAAVMLTIGEPDRALTVLEHAAGLARRVDDPLCLAGVLYLTAFAHIFTDIRKAGPTLEEAALVERRCGISLTSDTALQMQALLTWSAGKPREALALARAELDQATRDGDRARETVTLIYAAQALIDMDELDEALALSHRSDAIGREIGMEGMELWRPYLPGAVALSKGDLATAVTLCGQAVATALELIGTGCFTPQFYAPLVEAEIEDGLLDDARAHLAEFLPFARTVGHAWAIATGVSLQARLERTAGDLAAAEDLAHEALAVALDNGLRSRLVDSLEVLAGIALDLESHAESARLFAAARAVRDRTGCARCVSSRDADLEAVRLGLGEVAFESAWTEGAALSVEDAVAYARRGRGERKRPSSGWASLTPSELQVVRLVREGLTNAQMAERLFVSPSTVKTHMNRIFAKLGVTTRSQLAAEATRRSI